MKRELVKLRSDLNTAERDRLGKSTPESTQTLEVDLEKLGRADRDLLARRLERAKDGIFDVCRLQWNGIKEFQASCDALEDQCGFWDAPTNGYIGLFRSPDDSL